MTYGKAAPDANYELAGKFLLEIDGIAIMAFEKIKIGDSEWGLGEGRTGADPLTKTTFSGLKKPNIITIEKSVRVGGVDDVKEILEWHLSGSKDRRDGSIVTLDRDGQEIYRENFKNAWVSKVTHPERDASSDDAQLTYTFELSVSEVVPA